LLEAARSSKRDPDGTEAGRLERSLSVTGNFGAGSGSGALMKGSRFAADSMLEGDGFELPVREHRDSRMRTHLVVNHRVAVHVPVLIYRLRPRSREQQQIGAVAGSGVADGRCYDLGFADHRHGLEVEVAKLFPGGSRTSARWRSRRRRLILLHDTARMGVVGTAHKDPLPRRAPVRLDKQIDKQNFNRLRVGGQGADGL
jgi:hypothetical protein